MFVNINHCSGYIELYFNLVYGTWRIYLLEIVALSYLLKSYLLVYNFFFYNLYILIELFFLLQVAQLLNIK